MSAEIDMRTYLPEEDFQPQLENVVNTQTEPSEEVAVHAAEAEPQQGDKDLNFQAFREEIKQKISEVEQLKAQREADRREFQLQMDLLKANLGQQHQQAPKQRRVFDGMNDDDVLNVAEMRRELEARESGYESRIQELEFQQTHPDYAEVLNKHLTPLIQQKPHLARAIETSQNPAAFAYELGLLARGQQPVQQPQTQPSDIAQKIVENARKPATLAQAGGQSVLSKADYYATMSDQEFMKFASKNLEGI